MSTVSTSISASVIAIAKSLVAKIFVRKEATKTVRTFAGTATNPKTKKGKVKRYTTSTVNLGYEVIDTAATVRARKDAYQAAINEALGIETHVKNCAAAKSKEAVEAAAFTAEMTELEADIARINDQLAKYKSFVPAHVGTINPANTEIKIGGPSAGARRKAKARTRAIAQAKRMNALSVVLRYSQQPNTTVLSVADAFIPSTIEYGTAISSLITNTINSAVAIDIVCSADAAGNDPSRSAMSSKEDSQVEETTNKEEPMLTFKDFYNSIDINEAIEYYNQVAQAINEDAAKMIAEDNITDLKGQRDYLSETLYEYETEVLTVRDYLILWRAVGAADYEVISEYEEDTVVDEEVSLREYVNTHNIDMTEGPLNYGRWTGASIDMLNIDDPSRSAMSQQEDSPEGLSTDVDSPAIEANLEVAENLVKHCENDNHSEGSSMYITELFADLIFRGPNHLLDNTEENVEKANKEAKRKANFIDKFSSKLVAPEITNIGIIGNDTGRGLQGVNTKVKEFIFNSFECYGLQSDQDQLIDAQVKCGANLIAPAKTDDVKLDIVITDGMQLFSYVVAYATGNLTVEDKIEFCLAICNNNPEVKAFKNGIIISDVSFNFANGVVLSGTTERMANPLVDIFKVNFTGEHAVFLLALTALRAGKAVKYLVSQAVSIFQRDENYGAKLSEFDLANGVARNLDLATDFIPNTAHGKFPFFAIKAGKQADGKLADILARGEMAVVDKYNMKWAAKGIGAEAVLVGRNGNIVYNLNDASKTAKVYNRPASIKYTFANMKDRVKSHFAVALSNGTSAYSCGKKLRTAWTNSRFGHGSGVAVINPALTFDFVVGKSIRGVFNTLCLPAGARKGLNAATVTEKAAKLINSKIKDAVGKVYAPNQTIIEMTVGKHSKSILTNTNKAVDVRVLSGVALVTSDNEIDIKLNVEIVGKDEQYVKLRGIGKKCTTLPYEVDGIDADWDIILNIEAVKGYPALVEMYANSFNADCFYNSNAGTLTTPDGVVDLKEKTNALTEWACANTHETIISFEMARSCYQDLAGCIDVHAAASLDELTAALDSGKGADVYVEDVNATTVRIHERVECIMGDVVFDVEVSTPKESVSTTHLTMEAACGLLLQDKALGETLLKEVADKAKFTESLVRSAKTTESNINFDITSSEGRAALSEALGNQSPVVATGFANHRAILNQLAKSKELSKGFTLSTVSNNGKVNALHVEPMALAAFGGFSNGSATREIATVIELIYTATQPDFKGIDALVKSGLIDAKNAMKNWANNLIQSSNCLKKFTRSGKLIGGKVRTTYNPILNNRFVGNEDKVELPVVAINPNGNFAKLLKAEEGDIVGITRTPMPFMTAAILTFSTDVPDAHVWVSPKVWHAANEGK